MRTDSNFCTTTQPWGLPEFHKSSTSENESLKRHILAITKPKKITSHGPGRSTGLGWKEAGQHEAVLAWPRRMATVTVPADLRAALNFANGPQII